MSDLEAAVIGFGSLSLALCTFDALPSLPVAGAFWQVSTYLVPGCTVCASFAQDWVLKHP